MQLHVAALLLVALGLGGCIDSDSPPDNGGPSIVDGLEFPLGQGIYEFTGSTGPSGGWLAFRIDVPGNGSIPTGFHREATIDILTPPDGEPHWLIHSSEFLVPDSGAVPLDTSSSRLSLGAFFGPIEELRTDYTVIASSQDVSSHLYFLITDLELDLQVTIRIGQNSTVHEVQEMKGGSNVTFVDLTPMAFSVDAAPQVQRLSATLSHDQAGLEGLIRGLKYSGPYVVTGPLDYSFTHSDGQIREAMNAGYGFATPNAPTGGSVAADPEILSLCQPIGEPRIEMTFGSPSTDASVYYFTVDDDILGALGFESACQAT